MEEQKQPEDLYGIKYNKISNLIINFIKMHSAGFEPTNQKDTRLKRASLTAPQTMLIIYGDILLVPF